MIIASDNSLRCTVQTCSFRLQADKKPVRHHWSFLLIPASQKYLKSTLFGTFVMKLALVFVSLLVLYLAHVKAEDEESSGEDVAEEETDQVDTFLYGIQMDSDEMMKRRDDGASGDGEEAA